MSARRAPRPTSPAPAAPGRPAPEPLALRRDGPAVAAVLAAAIAIQLPIWNRWLSFLDEGAIAEIGEQIIRGRLPYRDVVHVAFPGVFYLEAALFRVFGPTFIAGRYVMAAAFTGLVVLVYGLARTVAGRAAALGAALVAVAYRVWAFPHWQMLSYSSLAVLLAVATVALLAVHVDRPRARWLVLAGATAGLAGVFKQDSAGFTIAGLAAFLWLDAPDRRQGLARVATFVAASTVAPAVAVAAFAARGLLVEMLWQTIWFPVVGLRSWVPASANEPHPYISFPPLWPPWAPADMIRKTGFFSYFPSLLLDLHWKEVFNHPLFVHTALPELFVRTVYVLPYAVIALVLLIRPTRHVRLLLFFAVALILSFNRPRDWIHLMVLYPATLVLLAPLWDAAAGPSAGARRALVSAAGGTVVAAALVTSYALALDARAFYATPLAMPRARLVVDRDAATVLGPLLAALTASPTDATAPLAALPYQPTLNFLSGRPPASRFITLLPLEEFPDRQEQILAALERDPRTQVVYGLQHLASIRRPQYYAPRLFAALTDRYRLGRVFSGSRSDGQVFALLERRPPEPERVLYDFVAHLADGRFSAEPAGPADPVPPPPSEQMWPFERPVLALDPAIVPGRSRLVYAVDVPPGARLRFGASMNPDEWTHFLPSELHFTVRVDGAPVFDRAIDPRRNMEDRRWTWADVPLAAGRHELAFETSCENVYGAVSNLAGWARPRIVAAEP